MDFARGRKTISRLHFLRESQHWTLEKIHNYQLQKLNELLIQAKQNSSYYNKKLNSVKLPLKSLNNLHELPILTKKDIRNNQQEIRCSNIPTTRFVQSRTGGSTGEPMVYYWDKKGMDWNRASVYRSAEWANTALGEKTVQMSGSHFDFTQSQNIKNQIVYFLQRYKDLSVAILNDEILEDYYQQVIKFKPTSIWGYAGGLSIFAEFILDNHADTDFSFLKAIMTSSETLWPKQRKIINQAFGGNKVYDQYGSRELYIASECDFHEGYHIHSEIIVVEIVNDEGNSCKPGEVGKVILTDLTNYAFPFIRYEIGDLAIMGEPQQCKCGLWLPKLRSVEGRTADIVTFKDRKLTAPNFTLIFSDRKGVQAFQIRQKIINELEVAIVPDKDYTKEFEKYIMESIKSMVPKDTKVTLIKEKEIVPPESGKRRFIISEIS
jgi:phenylacetate-CoA ligase